MTEDEWQTSDDPRSMLDFLRGKASGRKLRLFAVACCRRVEHMFVPEIHAALDVAERFADGQATIAERKAARARALAAGWVRPPEYPDALFRHARGSAKSCVCEALAGSRYVASFGASRKSEYAAARYELNRMIMTGRPPIDLGWREQQLRLERAQQAAQADLLRDNFGNPFHPVALDPAYLNADVVAIARTIYEGRDFRRMSELADALERAGCGVARVLAHLREPGEHVRGCWVIDLVLGKS